MTIREIEEQAGMTRANIRFYEAEGLLHPIRRENGYRDYTESDLAELRRIRLLRALGICLEDIRAMQENRLSLQTVLGRQMDTLAAEQTALERARTVCRELQRGGVSYASLDATPYLERLAEETAVPVPQGDAIPRIRTPWRRWFAFTLDMALYRTLWYALLLPVFHVNIFPRNVGGQLLDLAVQIVLIFLLEPLFLSRLGATPGKWILGLSIRDSGGGKLRYTDALKRTFLRWRHGLGFNIPVWSLVRLWRSGMACLDGETLDWECDWNYDSVMQLRDERKGRNWAYALCVLLLLGVLSLFVALAQRPVNRGELTLAQFCENYNACLRYYAPNDPWRLDGEGRWIVHKRADLSLNSMDVAADTRHPDLQIVVKDGIVTGVGFVSENRCNAFPSPRTDDMQLLLLSFAGAERDAGLWMSEVRRTCRAISKIPFQGFEMQVYGIRAMCRVEYEGYRYSEAWGTLMPTGDLPGTYSISFSIVKP